MKLQYLLPILLSSFLFAGCYTQVQTIERSGPDRSRVQVSSGGMYDNYYGEDSYSAYEEGYYDGIFDASIGFRSYNPHRTRMNLGFTWGRPFMGFGYSYGHYYDPYWHYAQLFDPFFYSSFGYYSTPYYMRYRHFGHFHSPFFGSRNVIVFNNYGSATSGPTYSGPRSSGVHRGNVTGSRENRLVSRGTSAGDTRTRLRGQGIGTLTEVGSRGTVRTRGTGYVPARGTTRGTVDRSRVRSGSSSRGTVDRRRAAPPPQSRTQPQRRGGSSSSGNVGRSRGSSGSSGNVGRNRGSSSSSGSSGRSRGGSSSSSGERNRGGDDGVSMIVPVMEQQQSYEFVMRRLPDNLT